MSDRPSRGGAGARRGGAYPAIVRIAGAIAEASAIGGEVDPFWRRAGARILGVALYGALAQTGPGGGTGAAALDRWLAGRPSRAGVTDPAPAVALAQRWLDTADWRAMTQALVADQGAGRSRTADGPGGAAEPGQPARRGVEGGLDGDLPDSVAYIHLRSIEGIAAGPRGRILLAASLMLDEAASRLGGPLAGTGTGTHGEGSGGS